MAGHFLLLNIPHGEIVTATRAGCTWSARMHADKGWTDVTRAHLRTALDSGTNSRLNLPPHCYLQFGPLAGSAADLRTAEYLRRADWMAQLTRPTMGLTALCQAANVCWNNRDRVGAVLAQATYGATSIEIYYVSGTEI